MTDRTMFSTRISEELKALVDADERNNCDVVEAALWEEFGGERQGAIERRIEKKKERIDAIRAQRDQFDEELEEELEELETLKTKRDEAVSEEEAQLEDSLNVLEDVPWDPDNPAIQTHAEKLEMLPEDLIEELEARAEEQGEDDD